MSYDEHSSSVLSETHQEEKCFRFNAVFSCFLVLYHCNNKLFSPLFIPSDLFNSVRCFKKNACQKYTVAENSDISSGLSVQT